MAHTGQSEQGSRAQETREGHSRALKALIHMPFDVTYETVDIELAPKGLFGDSAVRLQCGNYLPAAVMVSSFFIFYFVLVPIVFPMLKPTSEAGIERTKLFRNYHNFTLFIYSGVCCFSTAYWLHKEGQLFDWHALLCTPVEGTWLRALSTTFTISKIIEWIDTAYLIWLGSRPPQFLHLYHHATTFWLFCFVMNMPGPEKFGMLMNGFVHTLMYSHYWRSWPKPLVPMITILQIMQLATVTYAWTVSPHECPSADFANSAKEHLPEFLTPYLMVPVFLYFFIVFFIKRFCQKKEKTEDREKAE